MKWVISSYLRVCLAFSLRSSITRYLLWNLTVPAVVDFDALTTRWAVSTANKGLVVMKHWWDFEATLMSSFLAWALTARVARSAEIQRSAPPSSAKRHPDTFDFVFYHTYSFYVHYQSKVLNSKFFLWFLKTSPLLTKPAFICSKMQQSSNIVFILFKITAFY